jgi:hypothetical protein
MDFYTIFKFLHVMSAIAWLGGGVTLFALALMYEARKDFDALNSAVNHVAFLGPRWFVPTSLLTLVFGLATTFTGNLWGDAWVVLGLFGFAGTFSTGLFVMKPLSEAIAAHNAAGRFDLAAPLGARIMQVSKFDYVLMGLVIALMVLKPSWSDLLVLAIMATVLVLAAVIFLGTGFKPAAEQTNPAE